jgi:ABC-type polar amino acid transport system ATPase subunit
MISVRQLSKRFGPVEVLRDVSLDVAPGKVAAIIGPSGGGKSTFLRCLNALESFDAGSVRVGDLSLPPLIDQRRDATLLRQVRRRVGMVFQQFNLFPHFSVMDNLCEAPVRVLHQPRAVAEARATQLLDRVGLKDKCRNLPRTLSGGEMQRVAIARTLMMNPDVILFDEPTSALDPLMAREVLAVMSDLAQSGQTMIVVTHSLDFARNVASEVHLFADGRPVESGAPEAFFGDPRHDLTRRFLARLSTA